MVESVDGRIDCDMVDEISGEEYYHVLDSLDCDAYIEGKHSYQMHQCGFKEFTPKEPGKLDEDSFYKASHSVLYTVSVDTRGILQWKDNDDNSRVCIISQEASPEYLEYLRNNGISYIVAGKEHIDLNKAMEVLHDEFGVRRAAVVGGGKINGAFLAERLIDEFSVMIAPGIDGRTGQPALFDGIEDKAEFFPTALTFKEVTPFPNGVIWVRYDIGEQSGN